MKTAAQERRRPAVDPDSIAELGTDGQIHVMRNYEDVIHFYKTRVTSGYIIEPTKAILLMATVPPRYEACKQALTCFLAQSDKIQIYLLGDGYQNTGEMPCPTDSVGQCVSSYPAHGAGNRWRWVSQQVQERRMSPNTIVINVDDDMIPSPYFIQKTLCCFEHIDRGEALAWSGRIGPFEYHHLRDPRDGVIKIMCTSACAVRAGDVVGIENDPDAELLLGIQGDDELLLAAHLKRQGVVVRRPVGIAPIFCGPAQKDAVAQHRNPRTRAVSEARHRLYQECLGGNIPLSAFLEGHL